MHVSHRTAGACRVFGTVQEYGHGGNHDEEDNENGDELAIGS